jgi:hypothetical protein
MFICTKCIAEKKLGTTTVVGIEVCELCEQRFNCYDIPRKIVAKQLGNKVDTDFYTESVEDIMCDIEMRSGLNESWAKIPLKIRRKIRVEWSKILKENYEKFFNKQEKT